MISKEKSENIAPYLNFEHVSHKTKSIHALIIETVYQLNSL
jgi:hypothetical protein